MLAEQPEPQRLAETPLAGFEGELFPVLRTEVIRTLRKLRHNDANIEIAVDQGSIRASDRTEDIHEVELELKEGKPAALYRVAKELQADLGLILGSESKSDRGWRLLTSEPHRGEKNPGSAFCGI